jgi:hypothetical protein
MKKLCFAGVALLLACSFATSAPALQKDGRTSGEIMGKYRAANLPGWKKDVFRNDPSEVLHTVTFTNTVNGCTFSGKYTWMRTRKGEPPATMLRLNKDIEDFRKMLRDFAPKGSRSAPLTTSTTRFLDNPGVLIHWGETNNEEISDTRLLRFIYGGEEYWISLNVRGKQITPAVMKQADAVWEKLKQGLQLKK